MRYVHTYRAFNPSHRPMQSDELPSLDAAMAWASEAAAASNYHTEITCITTSLPDVEYGDRVIERQAAVIGVVLPNVATLISRTDARYPARI